MVSEAIKRCAEKGEVFRKLEECMGDDLEIKNKLIFQGQEHTNVKQNSQKSTYKNVKFHNYEVAVCRRLRTRQPVSRRKSGGGC